MSKLLFATCYKATFVYNVLAIKNMGKTTLIYQPLDNFSEEEINSILNSDNLVDLIRLPISVGMNHCSWKLAQDVCIKLSSHSEWRVRANSLTGLEYIARTKGKLEKHLVKPILLNALKAEDWEKLDIVFVTKRINQYLNWKIGLKAIERLDKNTKA